MCSLKGEYTWNIWGTVWDPELLEWAEAENKVSKRGAMSYKVF